VFNAFTKSLPQEKKRPFMDLMKRLRSVKNAPVGTTVANKDEKKKVMHAVDGDIHKLLGHEYKRYRTVQVREHKTPRMRRPLLRVLY
jgi:hypothetical protein